MGQRFECAWESMRPVPHIRIDLGDGEVLERTFGGNVITWFTLADGRAFDVQPGVLDADAYRAALERALANHDKLQRSEADGLTGVAVALVLHEAREWPDAVARLLAAAAREAAETGAEAALIGPESLSRLTRPLSPSTVTVPGLAVAPSKFLVERPVLGALTESPLEQDSVRATGLLRPQALGLLALFPLAKPYELAPHVFRLVLGIDLEDRYLGLAPQLLGRRDGFTEDK